MSSSVPEYLALDGEVGLITQEDSSYLIIDDTTTIECDPRFDKFATEFECGEDRFRRLRLLGYV